MLKRELLKIMSVDKLAHVVWECNYHIVIVSKFWYKFFSTEVKIALRDEIRKLSVWN